MFSVTGFVKQAAVALLLAVVALQATPAHADGEFPFGMAMTLDVARQQGSKRLPNLEIGDNGEAVLELWCKGGKGQFSVAGNTVIFVAGPPVAAIEQHGPHLPVAVDSFLGQVWVEQLLPRLPAGAGTGRR